MSKGRKRSAAAATSIDLLESHQSPPKPLRNNFLRGCHCIHLNTCVSNQNRHCHRQKLFWVASLLTAILCFVTSVHQISTAFLFGLSPFPEEHVLNTSDYGTVPTQLLPALRTRDSGRDEKERQDNRSDRKPPSIQKVNGQKKNHNPLLSADVLNPLHDIFRAYQADHSRDRKTNDKVNFLKQLISERELQQVNSTNTTRRSGVLVRNSRKRPMLPRSAFSGNLLKIKINRDAGNAVTGATKGWSDQEEEENYQDQDQQQNQSALDRNATLLDANGTLPSKPLCRICLKAVQQAHEIDLAYVDVTGGTNVTNRKLLHWGATFANGSWGYVHDVSTLRQNPPSAYYFSNPHKLLNACSLHDDTYRLITGKIRVVSEADLEQQRHQLRARGVAARPERLLCLIYTTSLGHARVQRIRETWGSKCDGFLVGSNRTDPSVDAVNIVHKGAEKYQNIWQKVRTMWAYVYDNYYEEFDWFHIGGDDMYLIVENLRWYLESEEIKTAANGGLYLPTENRTQQTPLFLGCRQKRQGMVIDIFNHGGSGYTLNKAALKALVVEALPKYYIEVASSAEDVLIAWLLRKLRIYPYDTKDETGAERYNPQSPSFLYGFQPTLQNSANKGYRVRQWYWHTKYSIKPLAGANYSAVRSVAFHYIEDDEMYRLYALIHGLCQTNTTTDAASNEE